MSDDLGVVIQPHLGRVQDNYKPQDNVYGVMKLAKVIQVHHKSATVDIQLLRNRGVMESSSSSEGLLKDREVMESSSSLEGRYSAKVLTSAAHFNRDTLESSGVVEPLGLGQLVVVTFLDGVKRQPIIIGSLHNSTDETANILVPEYPLYPVNSLYKMREVGKYLRVFPAQGYNRVDGIGGVEISHPSKLFMVIDSLEESISDIHEGFDHENLTEKDKTSLRTLSAHTEEAALPINLLIVHRSSFIDEVTTWTKLFINKEGMARFTRDNRDDKLSYLEFAPGGRIKARRQIDSPYHEEGNDFSEICLEEDGEVSILREKEGKMSEVKVTEEGDIEMNHHTGSYIKFLDNGDIIIKPANNLHLG